MQHLHGDSGCELLTNQITLKRQVPSGGPVAWRSTGHEKIRISKRPPED